MEFLIGSLITLISMFIVGNWYRSEVSKRQLVSIKFSQSHKYELVKFSFLSPYDNFNKHKETQSVKHRNSTMLKVFVYEGTAYWIKDNALYCAEIQGQRVDEKTTKRVDTINMNDVELKKIIFVIEQLTESGGPDDSRNSGN